MQVLLRHAYRDLRLTGPDFTRVLAEQAHQSADQCFNHPDSEHVLDYAMQLEQERLAVFCTALYQKEARH